MKVIVRTQEDYEYEQSLPEEVRGKIALVGAKSVLQTTLNKIISGYNIKLFNPLNVEVDKMINDLELSDTYTQMTPSFLIELMVNNFRNLLYQEISIDRSMVNLYHKRLEDFQIKFKPAAYRICVLLKRVNV